MLENYSALYVEDEEEVRTPTSRYLRRRLKELYEAENGEIGLKIIEEKNPDIVITDIEMPVMNGLKMIDQIREHYGNTKPIIVVTGYRDDEHYTDLANIHLYKPLDLKLLVETIENLLKKQLENQ